MKIGFFTKFVPTLLNQVVGEELYAQSLCRELMQIKGVTSAQVFTPGTPLTEKMDIMIHLNDTPPNPYADKHVLYMQNFYPSGSENALKALQQLRYDGFAFFSLRLLKLHEQLGYTGVFLPLAADTGIFHPTPGNPEHQFDVVFVGNDIKGQEETMQYILPAICFNFGLFGNWDQPWHSRPYKHALRKLSRGPVSREQAASLFSNSKIALNFTDTDSIIWDAMNLRFYEVLACKGFLISDRVPSAEQHLKDCVVFTDGGYDLFDKIAYYLARPEERMQIAERGYQYVTNNATVQLRAAELYKYLEQVMNCSLQRR